MEVISAEKLKLAMIRAGVGTTQLAKLAGVQACVISKILNRNSKVRLMTISKISKVLNVEGEELILKEEFK